jgi:hypothetical protein
MIKMLSWFVRIAGLGAFLLGMTIWRSPGVLGNLEVALQIHMTLGGIVALALAILAVWALSARVRIPAAIAALFWAAATVYVGTVQAWWVAVGGHPVIEVIHVLLGIGAIGLAEMLAAAITRHRASLT